VDEAAHLVQPREIERDVPFGLGLERDEQPALERRLEGARGALVQLFAVRLDRALEEPVEALGARRRAPDPPQLVAHVGAEPPEGPPRARHVVGERA
jgi:hypothetical protein